MHMRWRPKVFVYDKRGTDESDGEYTQNFELLAADAAAALTHAKAMARGRFSRAGYFGGSQGRQSHCRGLYQLPIAAWI